MNTRSHILVSIMLLLVSTPYALMAADAELLSRSQPHPAGTDSDRSPKDQRIALEASQYNNNPTKRAASTASTAFRPKPKTTFSEFLTNKWHDLTKQTVQPDTTWFDDAIAQGRAQNGVAKAVASAHRLSIQKLTTEQLTKLSENEIASIAPHLTTRQIADLISYNQQSAETVHAAWSPDSIAATKAYLVSKLTPTQARAVKAELGNTSIEPNVQTALNQKAQTIFQKVRDTFNKLRGRGKKTAQPTTPENAAADDFDMVEAPAPQTNVLPEGFTAVASAPSTPASTTTSDHSTVVTTTQSLAPAVNLPEAQDVGKAAPADAAAAQSPMPAAPAQPETDDEYLQKHLAPDNAGLLTRLFSTRPDLDVLKDLRSRLNTAEPFTDDDVTALKRFSKADLEAIFNQNSDDEDDDQLSERKTKLVQKLRARDAQKASEEQERIAVAAAAKADAEEKTRQAAAQKAAEAATRAAQKAAARATQAVTAAAVSLDAHDIRTYATRQQLEQLIDQDHQSLTDPFGDSDGRASAVAERALTLLKDVPTTTIVQSETDDQARSYVTTALTAKTLLPRSDRTVTDRTLNNLAAKTPSKFTLEDFATLAKFTPDAIENKFTSEQKAALGRRLKQLQTEKATKLLTEKKYKELTPDAIALLSRESVQQALTDATKLSAEQQVAFAKQALTFIPRPAAAPSARQDAELDALLFTSPSATQPPAQVPSVAAAAAAAPDLATALGRVMTHDTTSTPAAQVTRPAAAQRYALGSGAGLALAKFSSRVVGPLVEAGTAQPTTTVAATVADAERPVTGVLPKTAFVGVDDVPQTPLIGAQPYVRKASPAPMPPKRNVPAKQLARQAAAGVAAGIDGVGGIPLIRVGKSAEQTVTTAAAQATASSAESGPQILEVD